MVRLLLALGVAASMIAAATPAQAQTGAVSGMVVDESGAVVPGATVQLNGPTAHLTTVTASKGEYSFKNVPEGTYQLVVSLAGF